MRLHFLLFMMALIGLGLRSPLQAAIDVQKNLQGPLPSSPMDPMNPVMNWCTSIQASMTHLKWEGDPCLGINWQVGGTSVEGRAIVYADFGNPNAENTTLIFSTVHGDEVTPLYIGIQLARWVKDHLAQLKNTRVVIAPLVNPDGFFKVPRTRMNGRGVDINRNFATQDWKKRAHLMWKTRYRSDRRRFPGNSPRSEPETLFQENLIRKVHPQKILSIHSPLNHLDYDGPSALTLSRFDKESAREWEKLRKKLRAKSAGFFPGSLGNYAGYELGIPTVTLELPSADPKKADRYWKQFTQGIQTMIEFTVPHFAGRNSSDHDS